MADPADTPSLLERYLLLGLRVGRHIDGFVDAYYGPPALSGRVATEAPADPAALRAEARSILGALDAGEPIGAVSAAGGGGSGGPAGRGGSGGRDSPAGRDSLGGPAGLGGSGGPAGGGGSGGPAGLGGPAGRRGALVPTTTDPSGEPAAEPASRRAWLRGQLVGVLTTCRILAGERIGYAEEVESCYGVAPRRVPDEVIAAAHRDLGEALPGDGPLAERIVAWRESQLTPPDKLEAAIHDLADSLRERTGRLFGLPEGEHVDFEFVTNKPWSGFNYYLGGLRSRVAINVDLPVLSTTLGQLVAHEAYPGHHTEHSRKEVGLVRRRRFDEESIFLVGTPQCLLAEGLADLGLSVVAGARPEGFVAEQLRPLRIPFDAGTAAVVTEAGEVLSAVRANAAFRLHEDGADPEVVIDELAAQALIARPRAAKAVEFLTDPTWRAYVTCYIEGMPLCRRFVAGRPERFERLISEQLLPSDLSVAPPAPPVR